MGPSSASEVDEATSETPTETDAGPSNLLWISALVMGNWDALDDDPCGMALVETGAACADTPVVIIGRAGTPVAELPELFDFLASAPFYAATTGELVLESPDDLVAGTVEAAFVEALTSAEPSPDLYVWRGPLAAEPALSCDDWSDLGPNGTFFFFQAGSTAVGTVGMAPCTSELRLLCACAAAQ